MKIQGSNKSDHGCKGEGRRVKRELRSRRETSAALERDERWDCVKKMKKEMAVRLWVWSGVLFLEVSTEFATNRVLFLGESVFYLFLNIADVKICETVKKKVRGFSFIIYIYIYIKWYIHNIFKTFLQ